MAQVAYDFITLGHQLAASGDYKAAFDMYMCAYVKEPRIMKHFENEFRYILSKRNEELEDKELKAEIFTNFEKAVQVFPGNVDLLNDIGRYLYRYGYFSEALCHFEKALNLDNSYVTIEKNLNNAKNFLFPRSRFRTLNDKIRNNAFRAAIRSSVNAATDSVLDIDAGTGLLALYANECNPIAITACESSVTMAKLAECVMQDNQAQEVVIVNKPSMMLNRSDIYGASAVLLTDLLDSGLFGEYILQSLSHAWEHLLYKNSKIIPGRAEYFVAGIKCDELKKKYKLEQYMKNTLNVPQMNVHTTTYFGETYYSEDIDLYENVTYMSEPASLFTIDFNNYEDIYEKLYRQEPYIAKLIGTENGEIDMIVGWFNLYLTEEIMLTTDPRAENRATAWQQAIFFDMVPKKVKKNQTIEVPFLSYGGRLTTLPDVSIPIGRISPETLTFLNDLEYMTMITKSVGSVCVHLGQTVEMERVDVVDLNPFPLFGVMMLRRGANSLICHAKTIHDKCFLERVLAANNIPESKANILLPEYWTHDVFIDKKFHVIFSNILDFNGDVDAKKQRISQHLSSSHLVRGGLYLPYSVTAMGQLVTSEYLDINNKVCDDNVDYRVAKHVNKYQVTQATYLDIARLDYEPVSEVFEVAACEHMRSDLIKVSILKDADCNAILCWYKVQLLEDWTEIQTNRSNSFVESMAYMVSPRRRVFKHDEVDVLRCVDPDGSFKLVLDIDIDPRLNIP